MAKRVLALLIVFLTTGGAGAADTPVRIVAAGGDLTEIVYALGAGDRLVGVDSTSSFPPEAKAKAQIGYVRRIAAEGILSLKPDLVLGAYDMGPAAAVAQLRAAGVRVALAPDGNSVAGIAAKIRFVGEMLDLSDAAVRLADDVETALTRVRRDGAVAGARPRVLFVLSIGDSGALVGGDQSAAQAIIQLAGGVNAATGFEGYKPMSREAVLDARPDVVLMMASTASSQGGAERILARPEFKLTPAAKNRRLVTMDGMLLLGFGPRTPDAVAELGSALARTTSAAE